MSELDNQPASEETTGDLDGTTVLAGASNEPAKQEPTAQEVADWKASLPDELKSAKSIQSIKSVEDLVKSHINAQSVIGKKFEDMTPEQMETYFNKQGRPETPDGYQLDAPEGSDENLVGWFKNTAHELGLPAEQTGKLFSAYNELVANQQQQAEVAAQSQSIEDVKALKREFGPDFDKRSELAVRALEEFGGEDLKELVISSGLGNNPTLVKAFAKAGAMLAEGKFVAGNTSGKFGLTASEASSKIDTLRNDSAFMKAYTNPSSAGYKDALKQMEDLYKVKSYSGS